MIIPLCYVDFVYHNGIMQFITMVLFLHYVECILLTDHLTNDFGCT